MMKVCFLSPPDPAPSAKPWPAVPTPSLVPRVKVPGFRARPRAQRTGPGPDTTPEGKAGQTPRTGLRGGYGVRDPGGGLGEPESAPGSNLPPPAPAPRALSHPSSPQTGATHGERLRWAGTAGATGCAALGSALLPARCPPAEPRRSRGGGAAARPRRRLEARPASRDWGSERPLLGSPSGPARGERREPPARFPDTSRSGGESQWRDSPRVLSVLPLTGCVALDKSTNLSNLIWKLL